MDRALPVLATNDLAFPEHHLALAKPNGLLAMGGDLTVKRLIAAYRRGIFPWYDTSSPILWWTPDPRAILYLADLKISHSLHKTLSKHDFHYSSDEHFEAVIESCRVRKPLDSSKESGTWITPELKKAYLQLYELGYAHSIEILQNNTLVGGLYGMCIGRCFFGESMFHKVSDMSKVALVVLVEQLRRWGFKWIDCQVWSPHLASLGAKTLPRERFLQLLAKDIDVDSKLEHWQLEHDLLPI